MRYTVPWERGNKTLAYPTLIDIVHSTTEHTHNRMLVQRNSKAVNDIVDISSYQSTNMATCAT